MDAASAAADADDTWTVAGRRFRSRLIVGTGKYKDLEETAARDRGLGRRDRHRRGAAGEPVRPATRRCCRISSIPSATPTCPTPPAATPPKDAVRTLRLAREAGGWNLVKLEVLGPTADISIPTWSTTLEAAEALIARRASR